jgi:hypothetical protein
MFNWYILFNKAEFIAKGLVSFEGEVNIEGVGIKNFLVTQGNLTSIVYDDVLLSIDLNQKNPFRLGEYAVWQDSLNNIWLGLYSED